MEDSELKKEKILIIEDDKEVAEFLKLGLELENFSPVVACSGKEGLKKIEKEMPNLILLDLGLPDIDGLEVCKEIKKNPLTKEIPIIMLTARSSTSDKVTGLETGADDYIIKPFTPQELVARIKAIFRRIEYYAPEKIGSISKPGIEIELETKKVVVKNKGEIDLTPKEFELLYLLVKNSPKVLTREYLLKTLWGYESNFESRTLDVHILRLRKKLGETIAKQINTVEGIGFKFD